MGLDNYAVRRMTDAERQEELDQRREAGKVPVAMGMMEREAGPEDLTLDAMPAWAVADPAVFAEGMAGRAGLCGGLMSAGGHGSSMRGKVYAGFVGRVTGQDLYEFLEPEQVAGMADSLEVYLEGVGQDDDWEPEREEQEALAAWFRVCANNGYGVDAWF
jgi:hypothetical protein